MIITEKKWVSATEDQDHYDPGGTGRGREWTPAVPSVSTTSVWRGSGGWRGRGGHSHNPPHPTWSPASTPRVAPPASTGSPCPCPRSPLSPSLSTTVGLLSSIGLTPVGAVMLGYLRPTLTWLRQSSLVYLWWRIFLLQDSLEVRMSPAEVWGKMTASLVSCDFRTLNIRPKNVFTKVTFFG